MEPFIIALEIIGTVSFATSGAFTAIHKDMDLFGVVILGLTTSVGGGIIRDLILGITPPNTFRDPMYALIAIAVSVMVFAAVWAHKLRGGGRVYDRVMFISDTLGLAAFTVAGMGVAYAQGREYSAFLIIFVGVLTGVGGGVMRDLFAGDRPYIFVKHVYASASLLGAVACMALRGLAGSGWATVAGMAVIIVVRALSAHFKWNLPKVSDAGGDSNG